MVRKIGTDEQRSNPTRKVVDLVRINSGVMSLATSDLKEVVDLVRMNSDQTPFAGRSEPSLAKRIYAQVT